MSNCCGLSLQFKERFGRHGLLMAKAMLQHYHAGVPVADQRAGGEDTTMEQAPRNNSLLADGLYEETELASDRVIHPCRSFAFSNLREFIAEQEDATLEKTALGYCDNDEDNSIASIDTQDSMVLAHRRFDAIGASR